MIIRNLLILSVILNVTFTVLWIKVRVKPSDASSELSSGVAPTNQRIAKFIPAAPARAISASSETNQHQSQGFDWRRVESEDYKQYIANLRSIGCPEKTIRDIITADVNELFEGRRREMATGGKKVEYWKMKMTDLFGGFDEQKVAKAQELIKEKRGLLKELLGVEPEQKLEDLMGGINPMDALFDFVSSDKRTSLMEIEQRYGMKQAKLLGNGGVPDADDLSKLKELNKEKELELAKLMEPGEFEQYQYRMSQTAMMMRAQLQGFESTEQEFKDIFAVRKKYDDLYGNSFGMMSGTPEEQRQRRDAMDAEIQAKLGSQRFGDFRKAQDFDYQSMLRVSEKQGLDREAANRAYEIKRVAEEQANRLRANADIDLSQRNAALDAIHAETSKALAEALGEKGVKSLESQPGSGWLTRLKGNQLPPRIIQQDNLFVAPPAVIDGGAVPVPSTTVIEDTKKNQP